MFSRSDMVFFLCKIIINCESHPSPNKHFDLLHMNVGNI